jgi:hypothetical protein
MFQSGRKNRIQTLYCQIILCFSLKKKESFFQEAAMGQAFMAKNYRQFV